MIRVILAVVLLIILTLPSVFAHQVPCVIPPMDQVNARVQSRVTQSAGGFDYHYRVENGPGAPRSLIRFAVQAFTSEGISLTQASPSNWEGRGRIETQFSIRGRRLQSREAYPPALQWLGFGLRMRVYHNCDFLGLE